MQICLTSPSRDPFSIRDGVLRIARALATKHQIDIVYADHDGEELPADEKNIRHHPSRASEHKAWGFGSVDHAISAALMDSIVEIYTERPPDILELCDFRGHGFVPLQTAIVGHPSLAGTKIGLRLWGSQGIRSVLNGLLDEEASRQATELERECLRLSPRLSWPGGAVLDDYKRFFGAVVAEESRVARVPVPLDLPPAQRESPSTAPDPDLVRIVYVGDISPSSNVVQLVEACLESESDDWSLTLVGTDHQLSPFAVSAQEAIAVLAGDRIAFEAAPDIRGPNFWRRFDLLVNPAGFEVWNPAVAEAIAHGVPVLATRHGIGVDLIDRADSGWLIENGERREIRRVLDRILAEPELISATRRPVADELEPSAEETIRSFEELYRSLPTSQESAVPTRREDGVSGVITYFGEDDCVLEAVDSMLEQKLPLREIILVNDGSFRAADSVLERVADRDPRVRVIHTPNRGPVRAREIGALLARTEHLILLDSDDRLLPDFASRAIDAIRLDPDLAYVTTWYEFFADGEEAEPELRGCFPMGNAVRDPIDVNTDGGIIALHRRDLILEECRHGWERSTLWNDWEYYRRLRRRGRYGTVVPEFLAQVRVRTASLGRSAPIGASESIRSEMRSRVVLREREWWR